MPNPQTYKQQLEQILSVYTIRRRTNELLWTLRQIRRVGDFREHALHDACISIQNASKTATRLIISTSKMEGTNVISRTYLITKVQKVVDNPKNTIDMIKPTEPIIRTGLLPIWSDSRDHWRVNTASVRKKREIYNRRRELWECLERRYNCLHRPEAQSKIQLSCHHHPWYLSPSQASKQVQSQ